MNEKSEKKHTSIPYRTITVYIHYFKYNLKGL